VPELTTVLVAVANYIPPTAVNWRLLTKQMELKSGKKYERKSIL